MKKLPAYTIVFSAILVMAWSCDRDGQQIETPSALILTVDPPGNLQGPSQGKDEKNIPEKTRRVPKRFAEENIPATPAEPAVEYHDPGYFISAREPGRVVNRDEREAGQDRMAGGGRGTGIPLTTEYQKYRLEGRAVFSIAFDNDIFTNTDYYYTSGLSLEFFAPYLSVLPSRHLLPRAGRGSVNAYSVRLYQTLYTPIDPDKTQVQYGDRPFASYLVLGLGNISNHPGKHLRITSRLDLGVIGPAALGGAVQKSIHDVEPVGWQNQISNDAVVNYTFRVEKGVPLSRSLILSGLAGGEAGTLRNNLTAGGGLYLSNGNGYYESAFFSPSGNHRFSYYVHLSGDVTVVAYDATLEGGMATAGSTVYRIGSDEVSRLVWHGRFGAGLSCKWFSLEAEHTYLSPEFNSGKDHMWTRIKTVFTL